MFILGFIAGAVTMTAVTVVLFTRETRKSNLRLQKMLGLKLWEDDEE